MGQKRETRRRQGSLALLLKKGSSNFQNYSLKWKRIGYNLCALFLTWSLLEFGILACESETWRQKSPTRTHSTSKGLSIQSVRRLGEKGVGVGIWRLVGGDSKALTGLESEKVFVEVLPKCWSFKKDLSWGPFKVLFEVFNEHLIYRSSLRTQS